MSYIVVILQNPLYYSKWSICVDLRIINYLLGMQKGYTKYPCFICLWDSRAKDDHWKKKIWPARESLIVGEYNIVNEPLVEREKIFLPPLHIKLGLIKQFVKALNKEGKCFEFICKLFPGLSIAKLEEEFVSLSEIQILAKQ